jgi:hypothetical protein
MEHRNLPFMKLGIALFSAGALLTGCATAGDGSAPDRLGPGDGSGGAPPSFQQPEDDWPFDDEQCGAADYGKEIAGSMLVVLDRSGSMAYRWLETRTAVLTMMHDAKPELQVGLLPFPNLGCDYNSLMGCAEDPSAPGCGSTLAEGCCTDIAATPPVPLAPAPVAFDTAQTWFQGQLVDGFTPTRAALERAYEYMASQPSEGQRYVVLFTDGFPTLHNAEDLGVDAFDSCGEEQDILSLVEAANQGPNSVKTFAIGAPGSELASDLLGEVAKLGGTARSSDCSAFSGECHYQLLSGDFENQLGEVLDTIAGLVGDCTFEVPNGNDQANPEAVNVGIETKDGIEPVYRDPNHNDGWDFSNAEKSQVSLYGASCDLYNSAAANRALIVLGCDALVK